MKKFEKLAMDYFGEIVINKSLIHKAGFGNRAIPTYVGEWIIANFVGEEMELTNEAREKIATFVKKYVPDKGEKETIKNRLFEQEEVRLLDNFSVYVNLIKGDRYLNIPFLDETSAHVLPQIVEENEMLLSSGLWGVGTLFYIPPTDENPRGQIWLKEFKPFQIANIDIDYFREARKHFSTDDWIDLIVSSMGFNPDLYNERQKILLISRLIPMVEPRYNLVELAPKGTGKSFVFDNMSRYVAVRSGQITPAVLFYNDARKTPGLITRYDCVVIDEAQKVKADTSGELSALLKSYLESGRFGRGSASSISAEAGLVMLANIEITEKKKPINEQIGLFRNFPNFLKETAFIDRFSGLLPGWELPRITKNTPSKYLGFKGDIFGEILHLLRGDISYKDYVKQNMELTNCDDMRDTKAIEAGASGLLKILFPNKKPNEEEFYRFCVNPALEYRQRIRDELCKLDREYVAKTFKSKYPDSLQLNHQLPVYVEIDENGEVKVTNAPEQAESEKIPKDEPQNSINLDINRKPIETTIHIKEGGTGYSYQNLFYPYLKNAKYIKIVDPYIRLEYQIKNFIAFCEMLAPDEGLVEIHLVTQSENQLQQLEQVEKFEELQKNLIKFRIKFTFEFNDIIHDRVIEADNGWRIKPGRGLDIFQKPESWYGLGEFDQTKRKCRESEINYLKI
ncbi:MAG: BREX system Lon protease-like protein BrxL [Promethearchaeota archaeon]